MTRSLTRRRLIGVPLAAAVDALAKTLQRQAACPSEGWYQFGGDAQHSGTASVPVPTLDSVRWRTTIDLARTNGGHSGVHYGSPLVSDHNTVFIAIMLSADGPFCVEARDGLTGWVKWRADSDYTAPPHNSMLAFGPALVEGNALAFPGAGGSVLLRARPDHPDGETIRAAFYGTRFFESDPDTFAGT